MDQVVNLVRQEAALTPDEAKLDMPVQSLRRWPGGKAVTLGGSSFKVLLARVFLLLVTLSFTALGTYEIYYVVSPSQATWLQILFATLFALTFAWIAFAFASACLGFIALMRGNQSLPPLAEPARMGRTALLMPVYNEDPVRVMSALGRMASEIAALGLARHFDVFVLSDTRDARIAHAEEMEFEALQHRIAGALPVWYRRRPENKHKKAGNIADFVTRWGGAYDHMIVLDADSMMSGETLVALARAMAADPKAGIIQTVPLLRNRWTPYARLQQFACRVYGRPVSSGLAAWYGEDGNYWGHNAIIRTKAFAEAAGLPELKGRKPFGGHILSHDFIEAALIRRAGWSVTMLPELSGSYEEAPASLIDLAGRDRRWCQGNLQHMKIVTASGLHWASRLHLIQGIMSYLASPLWLLLLVTGLGLSAQAQFVRPEYFPNGFALFPTWPVFDPERALRLFIVTMIVLFTPKVLGVIAAMFDSELRKGCGGTVGLLRSFAAESVLSALLSPVMMLIQSRFVLDIFLGRDSGWNAQNRSDDAQPFGEVFSRHFGHIVIGLATGAAAWAISQDAFLWMLPIVLGLVLSAFVSWATSLPQLGRWAWRHNLFRIPEEAGASERLAPVPPRALQAAE